MLRAAIADRFTARGLPTAPDQILVTSGALHATALVLAALVGPGERVLVEHPTYPNVLHALTNVGARPVPVSMGRGPGRRLGSGADHRGGARRRAAAGLPRSPTSRTRPAPSSIGPAGPGWSSWPAAPAPRCWWTRSLAELNLDVPAEVPVAAHGAADSPLVLTVGSASKMAWGGLRVGWVRTSAAMVRRLTATRASMDLGGPVLDQLVVSPAAGRRRIDHDRRAAPS